MKERIFTNWTFTRTLYLILGVVLIVESITSHQWFGVGIGGYFASMGIFAFGCAAGKCYGGNCAVEPQPKTTASIQNVDLEEIKSK
ncbi:MAG: hypothetical protein WAT91_17680 [Saprospiraceae bacterium]